MTIVCSTNLFTLDIFPLFFFFLLFLAFCPNAAADVSKDLPRRGSSAGKAVDSSRELSVPLPERPSPLSDGGRREEGKRDEELEYSEERREMMEVHKKIVPETPAPAPHMEHPTNSGEDGRNARDNERKDDRRVSSFDMTREIEQRVAEELNKKEEDLLKRFEKVRPGVCNSSLFGPVVAE